MKISEIREWAAEKFGAHSHQEGQILAALGPIEEWLGSLAKYGANFELVPAELAAKLGATGMKPLHAAGEPPTPLNSGGTSPAGVDVMEVPVEVPPSEVSPSDTPPDTPPTLDTSTFVDDTGFAASAVRAPGGVEAPR